MIEQPFDWGLAWTYVAWAAMIAYFTLGLAITIGGLFDVVKMFRRLEAEHRNTGRFGDRLETFDLPK
ncbi:MAG: hypothetical protein HRF43_00935 [Phycisphaerae bacterium]|jgi:hypothetical protein